MTAAEAQQLARRIMTLAEAARDFAAEDRVQALLRQWQPTPNRLTEARERAWDLVIGAPSLLGVTAIDRLARATRTPADQPALALLRAAQVRLGQVEHGRLCDLATGEAAGLAVPPAGIRDGDVVLGRFARLPDGAFLPAGMIAVLDAPAIAAAEPFLRDRRAGPRQMLRCAETLIGRLLRTPAPQRPEAEAFDHPLDAIAVRWAARGGEPTAAMVADARSYAGAYPLFHVLARLHSDLSPARAQAYRRIAALLVETMALRWAHGSDRMNLDRAAARLDALVAAGEMPPGARALFERLRAEQGRPRSRAPAGDADLDRLLGRIRGLREKTVERGCTEAEALAAAEKVSELLDRYGLSLSELSLKQQHCEGVGVATDRKRRAPIDDCVPAIADMVDCRVWGETSEDDTLRYIFFGLPADVQAAAYLYDLIALAFDTETAGFQAGPIYRQTPSRDRRTATTSFQAGLARGIVGKLATLRRARDGAAATGGGRSLVPVKEGMIEAEMAGLGLALRRRGGRRERLVLPDAYDAGTEAGARFEYRRGIEAGA